QRAERTVRAEAEPAVGLAIHHVRGWFELARGRDADALAAFQAADRLAGRLAEPNLMVLPNRAFLVQTLVRLGETPGRRAGPGRPRRPGPRQRGHAHQPGDAAARPGQHTRSARRARPGPGRLRTGTLPGRLRTGTLAVPVGSAVLAGGDRPGRARRFPRRRQRCGARARPGRTRRRAVV